MKTYERKIISGNGSTITIVCTAKNLSEALDQELKDNLKMRGAILAICITERQDMHVV
jgi:homoserine kinase